MRIDGRRRSCNVDDRRGFSGKPLGVGGGFFGVVTVIGIITLLSVGNLSDMIKNVLDSDMDAGQLTEYVETLEDRQLADFISVVLAGTEVWTGIFRKQGWGEYEVPNLVMFHRAVRTGCGNVTSPAVSFYCSADRTVYTDLDFFKDMQRQIDCSGDFAYAYEIAHEVGHQVQNLQGILLKVHQERTPLSETEANRLSVRLELQADYFAGLWEHTDNRLFSSIETCDVTEALDVASKIDDGYLQNKAYGHKMPDSFKHGRSERQVRWLKKGLQTDNPSGGHTFSISYSYI